MAGDGTTEGTKVTGTGGAPSGAEEREAVRLTYRPQPSDTLTGLRVRDRIKRTWLILRSAFLALRVGRWLLGAVRNGSVEVVSSVLFLFVVVVRWGYPRLQASGVQRLVGRQGECRATVSASGISCADDHSPLVRKWSLSRGYRETPGHFVLLSRDPNVMVLDVRPAAGPRPRPGPA
ncbi:YcxB family protein [[Kitasatospora] papulosa]|uniref:YcxB family protein n=1 Tax=[Kitasatospora] papulosa TaxID=1464011 RepID=UPI0038129953